MKELKENGSIKNAVVTLVSDRPFYEGQSNDEIYKYFREEYIAYGDVFKPTGKILNIL